jgi:hypothetical protein
MNPKNLK